MKRILTLAALCLLALAVAAPRAGAAKKTPAAKAKTIRVLLTYGGHDFKATEFYAMMDALPGITYEKAKLPDQMDLLAPGLEKKFDVLVMYDQVKKLTPEQQKNFIALLETGIGVVSLHHNIGANTGWDEFGNVLGALWVRSPRTIGGQSFIKSATKDDQTFQIHVADPKHFITRGLKDFQIVDEAYAKYYLDPRVHVLLTTKHPLNAKSVAWVTSYGKSPVFYLQLGHDEKAYNHPSFRRLLARGIRWAKMERTAPQSTPKK